jgi:hypothetical protein
MRQRIQSLRGALYLLTLVVLAAGWVWAQGTTKDSAKNTKKPPTRVLFIGNSYTSAHDLPALVRALGAADKPKIELVVDSITPGGYTLEAHLAAEGPESARARLAAGRYDFVVVQEQSQRPLLEPSKMLDAARALSKELTAAKSTPIWYATWARQAKPETQADLTKAYRTCHAELGGRLAPVGDAWQTVLQAKSEKDRLVLHQTDGSHPTAAGSYLAALVIYTTLTGRKVEGLPARLTEPLPKTNGRPTEERVLVDLEPRVAKLLQQASTTTLDTRTKPR